MRSGKSSRLNILKRNSKSDRKRCAPMSASSCSTSSMLSGRTTSCRSIILNRASVWLATARRIRWLNTRSRASTCFRRCSIVSTPARLDPCSIFRNNLKIEQGSNRAGVDTIEHLLKHVEALLLVFNQRILLAVANQTDALFKMIERQEVVLPLSIDDVEHDDALIGAHRFRSDLLFLFRIFNLELFPDRISDFRRSKVRNIYTLSVRVKIVDGLDLKLVVFDIPIV